MKTYIFTLQHDDGKVMIRAIAADYESAKKQILESENCPESAIIDCVNQNYYFNQLEQLQPSPEYGYKIKIRGEDNSTKWMNVNEESAIELIKFLFRFVSDEGRNQNF